MLKVTFLPSNYEIKIPAGTTILEAAANAGVPIDGSCGGKGICGKCRIKVISGNAGERPESEQVHLTADQLAEGWALSCQRPVLSDLFIEVAPQSGTFQGKLDLPGAVLDIKLDPAVEKIPAILNSPTVDDQTPDYERLLASLPRKGITINRKALLSLPETLRKADFKVTAVIAGLNLISIEPGDTSQHLLGIALDIGTTTVMGSLLDLTNGKLLATAAVTNPQTIFGADVISRIAHANNTAGLSQLHNQIVEAVNQLIGLLLEKHNLQSEQIYEIVAVGNTAMSHLFLGVCPTYLALAPFIPVFRKPVEVEAEELGININPSGKVVLLPNIAGYVGSDTVGVILSTHLEQKKGYCLVIDIGTNGELILASKGKLLTCSAAAGPAFEGAQIKHGMRAAEGAIESAFIDKEDLHFTVIGQTTPSGICGSGLISIVAQMLNYGLIESSGRLISPEHPAYKKLPVPIRNRLRRTGNGMEFVLVPGKICRNGVDIVITQKDIHELQLAKGAIQAGVKILMSEAGITKEELSEVLLAGAFGNYVHKDSALIIGIIPDIPLDKVTPVGNAAGDGAKMALLSKQERARADSIINSIEHLELSTSLDFQRIFMESLLLKPY